jgi:hypothetical protein
MNHANESDYSTLQKKVLYIGWIGFNNLGYELLWNVFKRTFIEYLSNNEMVILASYWRLPNKFKNKKRKS